jgi:hypothetical protein
VLDEPWPPRTHVLSRHRQSKRSGTSPSTRRATGKCDFKKRSARQPQ